MRQRTAFLLPAFVVAFASAAARADNEAFTQCEGQQPELAIKACTELIESGAISATLFPSLLTHRGDAYAHKYDYDHAIKDYTHAVKLDPEYAVAFVARGFAQANRLNYDHAIKDYDQAIKLIPNFARAFYNRGLAKFGICDIDGADADIARAREIDPMVGKEGLGALPAGTC